MKMIVKFTEYYFPELVNKLSELDDAYFKYVYECINSDDLFIKYFRDNKTRKKIASELNLTLDFVIGKFRRSKVKVREEYNKKRQI